MSEAAGDAERKITLTEHELREIIKETVEETLLTIGIDTTDPIELQADARFLRGLRKTHAAIGSKAILTVVGLFIAGLGTVVVMGVIAFVKKHTGGGA